MGGNVCRVLVFKELLYYCAKCCITYIPFTVWPPFSPREQSKNAERKRMQTERNFLIMAIGIVLGFAVHWLSFNISLLPYYLVWDNPIRIFAKSCACKVYCYVYELYKFYYNPSNCFILSRSNMSKTSASVSSGNKKHGFLI